jgi:hypothetical protein
VRVRTLLAVLAGCLLFAAPASAADPVPGALYEGTTDAGFPISFRVAADGESVTDVATRTTPSCLGGKPAGNLKSETPFLVTEGTFSGVDDVAQPTLEVDGTFVSRLEAEGALQLHSSQAACRGEIRWIARTDAAAPADGALPPADGGEGGAPDPAPAPVAGPRPSGSPSLSLTVPRGLRLGASLRRGFVVRGSGAGAGSVTATATLAKRVARRYGVSRRYDTATATAGAAGAFALELKPSRRAARRLRGARRLALTVLVEARRADGSTSVISRTVTLVR